MTSEERPREFHLNMFYTTISMSSARSGLVSGSLVAAYSLKVYEQSTGNACTYISPVTYTN